MNLTSPTQDDDPCWISFLKLKMTTKFNSQPLSVLKMDYNYQHPVVISLTVHLYTVNVQKPWMNYVNNGLKPINQYLIIRAIICYEYLNILQFIIGNTQKVDSDDKNDF